MASWLDGLRADGGTLVVAGAPADKAATATVAPDGLRLAADDAAAALDWDLYNRPMSDPDWWAITGWSSAQGGEQGVAVMAIGACDRAVDGVRRATRVTRGRLRSLFSGGGGPLVPLDAGFFSDAAADRATFSALCTLLARRPDTRAKLADPAVAARLAADVVARPQPAKTSGMELRHSTADVHAALRELGFVHAIEGRPVEGEPVAAEGEVVSAVVANLGGRVDAERVAEIVRRDYVEVAPWPFAALTASGRSSG